MLLSDPLRVSDYWFEILGPCLGENQQNLAHLAELFELEVAFAKRAENVRVTTI